ncbi:MAG: WG repeat-containing protein [Bacteroidetes bacterium]|nr:WG repeat-containing protein [Bacteroidota bacterium]
MAETLFPVAKNGKWGLVTRQGMVILSPTYDYIEYNRQGKKFIYYKDTRMGLIDQDGTILSEPIYTNFHFLDTLWIAYATDLQWGLYKLDTPVLKHEFDSISMLSAQVLKLQRADSIQLFHTEKQTRSQNWYRTVSVMSGYLVAMRSNLTLDLLQPSDLTILAQGLSGFQTVEIGYMICRSKNGEQLANLETGQFITEKYDQITHAFNAFFILRRSGINYLFQADKNRKYPLPELDDIVSVNYPYLYFLNSDKTGIWDLEKEILIAEAAYDGISQNDGVFYTRLNGNYGILSRNGEQILAPVYNSVVAYDNLYLVEKKGLFGLVDRSGKIIRECVYNDIRVYEKNVKCFKGKQLDLLNIDASGTVQGETSYTDYMTISFDEVKFPRQQIKDLNFSGNGLESSRSGYEQLGWFQQTTERIIKDSVHIIKGNWGLRYDADSIAIQPRFADIYVRNNIGWTECYRQKILNPERAQERTQIMTSGAAYFMSTGTFGVSLGYFRLADHVAKKLLPNVLFQSIVYTDFNKYTLARGVTKFPVLLNRKGEVVFDSLLYVGDYHENSTIICEGGTYAMQKYKTSLTPCGTSEFMNDLGINYINVAKNENYFSIENGDWYFVNAAGKKMNEKPFDFVRPFHHNRSIVMRNGKWGVVDSTMKEIVPIQYQSVEEFFIDTGQFFKVANPVSNTYTYQRSSGNLTKTDIVQTQYYCHGRWFAKNKAGNYALTDTNLNALTEFKFQYVSPFEDGYALVTSRGKKSALDLNGQEILQGYKAKDINYLGYGCFEIIQSKGSLVVSSQGDTLLSTSVCDEVLATNQNYIFYRDHAKKIQAFSKILPLKLPKRSTITSYCLEDETILLAADKTSRIFSLKTQKYVSKALNGVIKIGPGCYVFQDQFERLGLISHSGDTLVQPTYMNIDFQPNNWALAQLDKRTWIRIDLNGNLLDEEQFTRYQRKKDYYIFYKADGIGLYDTLGRQIIPCIYDDIEPYNTNFFKTTHDQEHDLFYLNGERVIPAKFQDYKGYSKSTLVVKHGGQDYLYSGFLNKSLSFQNVTPVNSGLYILYERTHQGIYNAAGDTIVPIRYHNLIIDRGFIQVRFFNSFGYYTTTGSAIFEPYQ